jgi:hypothetical protein
MASWWMGLSPLNQTFYVLAFFFSTLFAWQFVASFAGLGGGHVDTGGHTSGGDFHAGASGHADAGLHAGGHGDVGSHTDVGAHPAGAHADLSAHHEDAGNAQHAGEHDARAEGASSLATFRLLSIRSVLAFGTLFSWAGALYLQDAVFPVIALIRAVLWGLAGMVIVALFFWVLPRLTEEGTQNLDTAVGTTGQVYINIPEDGLGQIRVLVSGTVSFIRARSRGGHPLAAGTMVRVVQRVDAMTLEVEELES